MQPGWDIPIMDFFCPRPVIVQSMSMISAMAGFMR